MSEKTKVTLTKPITVHAKETSELEMSAPNGGTIRRCGYPFKWEHTKSGSRIQHINSEAVAAYVSELANIPPNSVDQLSPADFLTVTGMVVDFFGDASPETSSGDTSS